MIDRLKIWLSSKAWFWVFRASLGRIRFGFERRAYARKASITKGKTNARILGSFAWIGVKSLFWVVLGTAALVIAEMSAKQEAWLAPLSAAEEQFNVDQLRLYAQLLTAIFSIYFATIGIILSAGYTRLRRDIISMLTSEQVGSVYSRLLVLSAIFCLVATTLPSIGFEAGLLVYFVGTILTLLSSLALFPLGQRLFNFFDLNVLIRSDILPNIARHIEGAANQGNSASLANHHSSAARHALEQLSYIDDRIRANHDGLGTSLPALTSDYTALLLHYLSRKHEIDRESYWFPRLRKHKQWFLAGDTATSMALETSSQDLLTEEKPDYHWLEKEINGRLSGHIELAFQNGNLELALKLITRFWQRAAAYAVQLRFDAGMQELLRFKEIIEKAFGALNSSQLQQSAITRIGIADTWAALGSNLCLETIRRIMTFEKELKRFFDADEWSEKSLRTLPAFLQDDLAVIVRRIEFEEEIEGRRLSPPKYIQQLAIQKLLKHYARILPEVCDFYQRMVPEFAASLTKMHMPEAATQVLLASLHSHWKLPRWFDEFDQLYQRYMESEHYKEAQYALPKIDMKNFSQRIEEARDLVISTLGSQETVEYIFDSRHNDELPDHFGQIYFELAEACVSAIAHNNEDMLEKILSTFMSLAFLAADSKFANPSLDIDDEFRLHLISTAINDLASVVGFAILYGAYFENERISKAAIAKFDKWIALAKDKHQYLKRMILISNPHNFSISASPRGIIRMNWRMSFEHRARTDGFGDRMGAPRAKRHPNKIVREFLNSHCDASHLFFAMHILPSIDQTDIKIDYQIADLARRLSRDSDEDRHEDP